jgi:DNA-binding response OmpR family regulator
VIKGLSYTHDLWGTSEMRRLLVVENNPLFRECLALFLERQTGIESIQARDLAEARSILSGTKNEPVCVVVNLDLPNGDGIELLKQFRSLRMVALVTNRNLQRRALALEAGADEVLLTAEPAEKVVGAVRQLVGA